MSRGIFGLEHLCRKVWFGKLTDISNINDVYADAQVIAAEGNPLNGDEYRFFGGAIYKFDESDVSGMQDGDWLLVASVCILCGCLFFWTAVSALKGKWAGCNNNPHHDV